MNVSECIQPDHLRRLAVVYIRQSSPQQIVSNQESLQLQYNLAQRAQTYGWNQGQICVIDADLGCSGRSADNRPGFQELVTLVNEEAAGILFAYDVTRLARNCTDWYQLLDLCGYRHCLVGDQDGIYDPATPNGRLILGLKGLIAELELHTLQQRMNAGLLNKAQRGELAQLLPVGLVREPSGQVVKHPNQEVQSRLALVFATFLQVKSAAKVVGFFHDRDLRIPRRGRDGAVVWRSASPEAIGSILKNPAYAGAFVHGRTRTVAPGRSGHKPWSKRLPVAEWKICLLDKYPAYIDWTTFEKIQTMLRDNHSDYGNPSTRGVPRRGKALLHGILYCGACGHQLVVSYKKRTTYICNYFRQRQEGKLCQYLPAEPIEAHVVQAYLEALVPAELDLYTRVLAARQQQVTQVQQAQRQQLERLRYQARLAERQYHQVDPDNRLVAAELEKRWEAALRDLQAAEANWARQQQAQGDPARLPATLRQAFTQAGTDLSEFWRHDLLSAEQRKALLRCLIDKVVVHRDTPDRIQIRIVWKGGDTTTAVLAVKVGAWARLSFAAEMEQAIGQFVRQGKTMRRLPST